MKKGGRMIKLTCESKIAYESPDHLNPWGTRRDNNLNLNFNRKINKIFKNDFVNVLDLGCSGGAFVKSCLDQGHLAVGLEGSDYSLKHKRAEWATIPNNLFTCDITKEFSLNYKFNLITAWEVLEHLPTNSISQFVENISNNIKPHGIFVASVCSSSDKPQGVELHLTRKNKKWWLNQFKKQGFYEIKNGLDFFGGQFVRGRAQKPTEFHLILSKNPNFKLPPISKKEKLLDKWIGSKYQRQLKYLIGLE